MAGAIESDSGKSAEKCVELVERLNAEKNLSFSEWVELLSCRSESVRAFAAGLARRIASARFGNGVFVRGIVEFSNYCRNDCLYCGIRRSNNLAERFRLSENEILDSCEAGYEYGFRTFVLQSGEDRFFTPQKLAGLVASLKQHHPDCAVTLSVGELKRSEYQLLFDSGADRYLLRHETADAAHYAMLHPAGLSFDNRMRCLADLKEIGFQTGCGFMVGSPFQTPQCVARDMLFMASFKPHMIGIGPFIPHRDTPFAGEAPGSVEQTLFLLSLCRIMLPDALLPATTALGTLDPEGREKGILAGANVIMPNITPCRVRDKYMLYNNKNSARARSAITGSELQKRLNSIGFTIRVARGDYGEKSC